MNDKSVNLLDQYDMTVKSISKGRGTLICDTDIGKCIFKEYKGKPEKLELIKCLQDRFTDTLRTDNLIPTKENTLYVKDPIDNTTYILTSHIEGKECNHRSEDDLVKACSAMGRMHLRFMTPIDTTDLAVNLPINFYPEEMQRHTTECKRVYNYLKKRTAKTEFERKLLNEYNYFLDKAVSITKEAEEESKTEYEAYVRSNHLYCHGDYQYHNVLFGRTNDIPYTAIVNMEHLSPAPGINDFCLFFRKVCQKHDWSIDIAATMLDAYQNRRAIPPIELRSLRLMLEYPEKFWKIADHYYNSKKSWMPSNNLEKLNRLIKQEKNKEKLINKLF